MSLPEKKGLSESEAKERQQQYGRNVIEEHESSFFARFFKKIWSPIPIMIEVALALSALAGRWEDFVIIATLLAVNLIVDILQEEKARSALDALKQKLAPTALVMRNSALVERDAADLVPGDIIKLTIGDIVPADAKLIGDNILQIDQSSVTGESLPIDKESGEILFSGSIVHTGSAFAEITATGQQSSLGKNADLVARAAREKESHFQKAVFNIGKFLIALSSVLVIIVFATLIGRGDSLLESIRFGLVLAIASIPVALPVVLSVTMAIGASLLAKKHAVVSHFQSVEELAGVDELCVDKTGTLTKNALAVMSPTTYGNFSESELFISAVLALDETKVSPIEHALFEYAKGHKYVEESARYHIAKFTPFDPVRKMSESLVEDTDQQRSFRIFMGASQAISARINNSPETSTMESDVQRFASEGFRVLAVAKEVEQGAIVPVGLIPLADPPRDDAKEVIAGMKEKGIRARMLTGDNSAIAAFIARLLGIGERTIRPAEVRDFRTNGAFADIENDTVFAEVIPEDKYRIVESLQQREHIVAMTGDGINDAPALKKADVGIAVSGASPAARAAADIVLLDNGLSVIQDAIYGARQTFARMQSYALFRISETVRIVLFITLAILIYNDTPISAIMIILLALLNDIPVMSIAYDHAPVHEHPIRWNMRETLFIASILGFAGVISSFGLLTWLHAHHFSAAAIQTILFLKLDVAGHSTLYLTRTGRKHFWEQPFPALPFFLPAFGSRIAGTLIAAFGIFMQVVSWQTILFVWLYATLWFFFNDQLKVLGYKIFDRFSLQKQTAHS